MVLVRRRNAFVIALVRELKREQHRGGRRRPAGPRRGARRSRTCWRWRRFVLLPQDDLNLACLLKSPLVGLDEESLFEPGLEPLRPAVARAARARRRDPRLRRRARAPVAGWLARADYTTPFDFFAAALGPEGGRARLLERLGREAADPIDELLARALQYQRAEAGSLQGFLRWFEAGGGEIKRDLDAEPPARGPHSDGACRQGPAGADRLPARHHPRAARHRAPAGRPPTETRACGLPRSDDANEAARAWRAEMRGRSLEEQNRLLYVAMTRAEDRLYVGGWVGAATAGQRLLVRPHRRRPGRPASTADISLDAEQPRGRATKRLFDFTALLGAGRAGRATATN